MRPSSSSGYASDGWRAGDRWEDYDRFYQDRWEEESSDISSEEGATGGRLWVSADGGVWWQDRRGWWTEEPSPAPDPVNHWWKDPEGNWQWHLRGSEAAKALYEKRQLHHWELIVAWERLLREQYRKLYCLLQVVTTVGWRGVCELFFNRAVRWLLLRQEAWVRPVLRLSHSVEVPRSTWAAWRWLALVDRNQRSEAAIEIWKQTRWAVGCGLRFRSRDERVAAEAKLKVEEEKRRVRALAQWQVLRCFRICVERLCATEEEEAVSAGDAAAGTGKEEAAVEEKAESEASSCSLAELAAENDRARREYFEEKEREAERWRRAGWVEPSRSSSQRSGWANWSRPSSSWQRW